MNITTFESVYKAYTRYDNPSMDLTWDEIVAMLSQHDDQDIKENVIMFNLAKFKDQYVEHELGRKYIYKNNERTDEYIEIPETIRRCKSNVISISGIVVG